MDSHGVTMAASEPKAFQPHSDDSEPAMPAPVQGEELGQTSTLGADNERDAKQAPQSTSISEELRALQAKITELEERAKAESAKPAQETQRPDLVDQMEQYHRMEKCLYNHRKEWETQAGAPNFDMMPRNREGLYKHGFPPGPWSYEWRINPHSIDYRRPDPFDPTHNCTALHDHSNEASYGDFDHTIDYGNRRDRLRKTFEWEMDRLYLAEETEKRKRERDMEEKQHRAKEDRAKERSAPAASGDGLVSDNGHNVRVAEEFFPKEPLSQYAKPHLTNVEWSAFKQLGQLDEHASFALDILIGDPVLDEDISNVPNWFGYSGTRSRKVDKTSASKTASTASSQSQLPERIRIHSGILIKILDQILGNDGSGGMSPEGRPVVHIRPFKALHYCERALGDWYTALQRKFSKATGEKPKIASGKTSDSSAPVVSNEENLTGISELGPDELGHITDNEKAADNNPTANEPNSTSTVKGENKNSEANENYQAEDQTQLGDDEDEDEDEEALEEDDPDNITKSKTALEHLECLMSFMDEHIVKRRDYLESDQGRKVFFSDLWQLFRPGMEVIQSDGKQAYRVISVKSARHRVVPALQRWYEAADKKGDARKPGFRLTCAYLDFNGRYIGPAIRTFDFKRFDGERDVTSFDVYPLRFHPLTRSDFNDAEWKKFSPCSDNEKIRQKLVHRGAKFLETASVKHMYYAGPTLDSREEVEGQVVVDFETAFFFEESESSSDMVQPRVEALVNLTTEDEGENDPRCRGDCCRDDVVYDDTDIDQRQTEEYVDSLLPKHANQDMATPVVIPQLPIDLQNASDDELLITSNRVFGFILRSRKWAQLDLAYLSDAHPVDTPTEGTDGESIHESWSKHEKKPAATAFDRLVLEEGHRPMIVSLIAQHFRDKEFKSGLADQVDIVKGKGKGLILLLHGAPGVGKTSTAEGVAELFKKPLFQITCGDLGTTAKEVEKTLETNFALANRWGCILLLDEADVFLAERTKEDFTRNGLVAVFLRVLEYYAGILFLTTNRVGDFDEAFTSRIHMSLYYPELNQDKTVEVFKINMAMIEERFALKKRKIEIDKFRIGSFASEHFVQYPQARWNGRQIRNACQTALALAEFEAQGSSHETIINPDAVVKLNISHFNTVRNAYLEFTKYMIDLYGSNAARRAKEAKLRAIWVDENDRVVGVGGGSGVDRRTAFAMASQPRQQGFQSSQGFQQPMNQQQTGFQQPHAFQHQGGHRHHSGSMSHQAAHNPSAVAPQPGYAPRTQSSMQGQMPTNQVGDMVGPNIPRTVSQSSPSGPRETEGQFAQPQPSNSGWFQQGIHDMYSASTGLEPGQGLPNPSEGGGNTGFAPGGQHWRGPQDGRGSY